MGKLFGTDGIRGQANQPPMDAQTALAVGQAVTHFLRKQNKHIRVIIGKDTRLSGYMLESSLEAGITSMGGDPYLVGVLPTPGIAFMTRSMRADAGIVISASHNPYDDNGIKIFSGSGYKLSDEQEEKIESLILDQGLPKTAAAAENMGRAYRIEDAPGQYSSFLRSTFPAELTFNGFKIVIDASNGATYHVGPETFIELGADVDVIHNKPNGQNINKNCGSQHTEDLEKRVIESGANVGLAFDGDGDRLIAVDEKGQTITGDQVLLICALLLKKENLLKNNLLVSTVMSNFGLTLACKKYGLELHASKVGDRYVLEDMQRLGSVLGGEDSGHTIFLQHHTTGDGILTALQLIAVMLKKGKPLSELAAQMEVFPQKLINVDVAEKPSIETIPALMKVIAQVEKGLGEKGRVLVRYSGTQKMCRVMVEGPTKEITDKYCQQIVEVVQKEIG